MSVTNLEFSTQPFEGGRSFGDIGAYEERAGRVSFALDPTHPLNSVITDIGLAPRAEDGRVHFSADFHVLSPSNPARGNRRLLFDVANRGNRVAPRMFDVRPAPPRQPGGPIVGDGWLLQQGYTVAWCGWQHDPPDVPGLLRAYVPEARLNGQPLTGKVAVRFQPTLQATTWMLSDAMHEPYPVLDLDEADATLRTFEYAEAPGTVIPRAQWRFARIEGDRVVPDRRHIYFSDGFLPGRFYEVVYTAKGAPLTGLGLAGIRDFISFMRFATESEGNPWAGKLDHTLAFGASQSGGVLRAMLYLGLCEDEEGRLAIQGLIPHIAGAFKGEFNWRFGQPSYYGPRSLAYVFPYSDADQAEPRTGRVDGLQRRAAARNKQPAVMYTNTSAEYWYLHAALCHTRLEHQSDLDFPANVRSYHFSGTHHVRGALPLTCENQLTGTKAAYTFNTVDYGPLLRAVLVNLDRWVTEGVEPPPSRYPRFGDGTLVDHGSLPAPFAGVSGWRTPAHLPGVARADFGPAVADGIATQVPPAVSGSYPTCVPSVDEDGNDLPGVRHPDVAVPLATHTGWNTRHADIGGEGLPLILMGSTVPFPRTAEEAAARNDPRRPIAERYAGRDDYLASIRRCAEELVSGGYLLASDVETVVQAAGQRWDAFAE